MQLVKSCIQPISLEYIRAEILAGDLAIYPNFLERCYRGWIFAVDVWIDEAIQQGLFPSLPAIATPGKPNALYLRNLILQAIIDVAIMVGIWEHLPQEEQTALKYQKRLPQPAKMLSVP